jgi:hypothetical protein
MGYTFRVGNAVPSHNKDDFPYLSARWEVEGATSDEAPVFEGDEMTGNTNERSPSYTVWSDFCKATGLYEFFYDERGHLHASHPGCVGITKEDANFVTAALNRYRAKSTLPPGFEKEWDYAGPANFDYNLARLMWLEYWMQWAVNNCETPAIQNT